MKRDNAYYEPLLKRKFPKIHKDFVEGRYPSLRRALIAAGIKKEFSTGEQLQRLWAKASAKEQGEFRAFIAPKATAMIAPGAAPAFRSDGSFEPWARDRVKEIMDRRGIKTGTICSEIGIPPLSPSIGLALNQKSRIRDTDTRAKLEKWIADNGHV